MYQKNKLFYQYIGAIVIFLSSILFYLVCNFNNQSSIKYYTLTAHFPNVAGLETNDSVKLSGISIGYIKNIQLDKHYFTYVTLCIQKNFFIPLDSTALIYSENLLGKKYIMIKPGLSNKYLKNGQSFIYTQGSVALQNLLQTLLNKKRINQ